MTTGCALVCVLGRRDHCGVLLDGLLNRLIRGRWFTLKEAGSQLGSCPSLNLLRGQGRKECQDRKVNASPQYILKGSSNWQ